MSLSKEFKSIVDSSPINEREKLNELVKFAASEVARNCVETVKIKDNGYEITLSVVKVKQG